MSLNAQRVWNFSNARESPGRTTYELVTLVRGVTRDVAFEAAAEAPTRTSRFGGGAAVRLETPRRRRLESPNEAASDE
jgi:hypothetical protein